VEWRLTSVQKTCAKWQFIASRKLLSSGEKKPIKKLLYLKNVLKMRKFQLGKKNVFPNSISNLTCLYVELGQIDETVRIRNYETVAYR
jgi:hypothetical protein